MPTFREDSNLILACHITGIFDVNRNTTLPDDDFDLVKEWANSIKNQNLTGILFHNNFSEATIQSHQNQNLRFVKVELPDGFSPNVFRYFLYLHFIKKHIQTLRNLFVTDVSDVVVIQNPFDSPLFISNPGSLFCGDEPETLENDWMKAHSAHLRSEIADFADYEEKYKNTTLLNCGIIGGNAKLMLDFFEKLWNIHEQHNFQNRTAFTGDMGAFNYLTRTQFNSGLFHGTPVNTIFKEYQTERTDCWFRHK